MPSRKQRRRREKERRHEYEYVYVDGEGREVEGEQGEPDRRQPESKPAARARNGRAAPARRGGSGRKVDPPSWRRAVKRSLIFAPFMFLTLYLLDRNASVGVRALVTAQMLVFFVPFTYLIDRTMYRRFAPKAAPASAARERRSSKK